MPSSVSPTRYSNLQIGLHWAIALLFTFNYFVSDGMGRALRVFSETGAISTLTARAHIIAGITLLLLMVARLVVRMRHGAPAVPAGHSGLIELAVTWGHRALYLLLFALPIAGLVAWFGGVKIAGEAHEIMVNITLALIAGHISAALFHQFYLKDNLLRRMRPNKG